MATLRKSPSGIKRSYDVYQDGACIGHIHYDASQYVLPWKATVTVVGEAQFAQRWRALEYIVEQSKKVVA